MSTKESPHRYLQWEKYNATLKTWLSHFDQVIKADKPAVIK